MIHGQSTINLAQRSEKERANGEPKHINRDHKTSQLNITTLKLSHQLRHTRRKHRGSQRRNEADCRYQANIQGLDPRLKVDRVQRIIRAVPPNHIRIVFFSRIRLSRFLDIIIGATPLSAFPGGLTAQRDRLSLLQLPLCIEDVAFIRRYIGIVPFICSQCLFLQVRQSRLGRGWRPRMLCLCFLGWGCFRLRGWATHVRVWQIACGCQHSVLPLLK
jgi:hypothetical protein